MLREGAVVTLSFMAGTLELRGWPGSPDAHPLPAPWQWDPRTECHRAPAVVYADIVRELVVGKTPYTTSRGSTSSSRPARARTGSRARTRTRPSSPGRSVAVAGSSFSRRAPGRATSRSLAIDDKKRSALVVAPTLDLVRQWYDLLGATFGGPIGVVGGGRARRPAPSPSRPTTRRYIHMEHLGARFGLVVFDECHHLPSAAYSLAARACLAPYRLGLTATPERTDGATRSSTRSSAPIVYRKEIVELSGDYLAEYDDGADGRRALPVRARGVRRRAGDLPRVRGDATASAWSARPGGASSSCSRRGARTGGARWRRTGGSARSRSRRRRSSSISATCSTRTGRTARSSSRRTTRPPTPSRAASSCRCITHQTKVRERSAILAGLGERRVSRGRDVEGAERGGRRPRRERRRRSSPGAARCASTCSASGASSASEGDKRAVLYELVTAATSETYTSDRRREHGAYR